MAAVALAQYDSITCAPQKASEALLDECSVKLRQTLALSGPHLHLAVIGQSQVEHELYKRKGANVSAKERNDVNKGIFGLPKRLCNPPRRNLAAG